jgi:hypothetical protein
MPQCSTEQFAFEPPYTIEVGGEVQCKSVPTYARAIALAEAYVNHGTTRKVEVFDQQRRRVYKGGHGLIARGP